MFPVKQKQNKAYTPSAAAQSIGITRAMVYRFEKKGLLKRVAGSQRLLLTSKSVEGWKAIKSQGGRVSVVFRESEVVT